MRLYTARLESPIGLLTITAADRGIVAVDFAGAAEPSPGAPDCLRQALGELREYFAGHRTRFTVPLLFTGTPFQQAVWAALQDIPFGQTAAYRDVALRTGRPRAVRAVGAANGRNKINIIVPCHRVVGADGSLTGYGGGLERKQWLLAHEAGVINKKNEKSINSAKAR